MGCLDFLLGCLGDDVISIRKSSHVKNNIEWWDDDMMVKRGNNVTLFYIFIDAFLMSRHAREKFNKCRKKSNERFFGDGDCLTVSCWLPKLFGCVES